MTNDPTFVEKLLADLPNAINVTKLAMDAMTGGNTPSSANSKEMIGIMEANFVKFGVSEALAHKTFADNLLTREESIAIMSEIGHSLKMANKDVPGSVKAEIAQVAGKYGFTDEHTINGLSRLEVFAQNLHESSRKILEAGLKPYRDAPEAGGARRPREDEDLAMAGAGATFTSSLPTPKGFSP